MAIVLCGPSMHHIGGAVTRSRSNTLSTPTTWIRQCDAVTIHACNDCCGVVQCAACVSIGNLKDLLFNSSILWLCCIYVYNSLLRLRVLHSPHLRHITRYCLCNGRGVLAILLKSLKILVRHKGVIEAAPIQLLWPKLD
jgi:hypothetical protein